MVQCKCEDMGQGIAVGRACHGFGSTRAPYTMLVVAQDELKALACTCSPVFVDCDGQEFLL